MSSLKTIAFSSLLLLAGKAYAQIHIPVADVSLDVSSAPIITLAMTDTSNNVTTRSGRLSPFIITNVAGQTAVSPTIANIALWFCMDPLQTIYTSGSGAPNTNAGSDLIYQSQNPANFDNWSPANPAGGLTTLEKQYLANIFSIWAPSRTNTSLAESLQLAVWEIVNENLGHAVDATHKYDLFSGSFDITKYNGNSVDKNTNIDVLENAQYILDHVTYQTANVNYLTYLIDGTYSNNAAHVSTVEVQDLLGWCPPIPESSSYATGAVGLLGLAVVFKLRNRKSNLKATVA